jgi:undecaprenyl-diphosphatase
MLEFLINLDTSLFMFFNVTLANPVTDLIMPIITNDWFLRVLYAVAVAALLIFGNARLRWVVLVSVIVIALTDQLSAGLLKPMIGRLRPCHVLDGIHLLVDCGGGKSMPSSHAANSFGQAVLFAMLFPRLRWSLLIFAALVAMSRVMVGVHYPFDILVGAVIGTVIGYIAAKAVRQIPAWKTKSV